MVGPTFWAAVAARIKNNVVRGLGAAYGGRAELLRTIPSEDTTYIVQIPGSYLEIPGRDSSPVEDN